MQSLIQQNAATVIQKIQQSGLSPEQIRSRLQAAGYPSDLLDQYIQAAQSGTAAESLQVSGAISDQTLKALYLLAPTAQPQGVQPLSVTTGYASTTLPAVPPESLPLQLFGTDVFRGRTTQFQPLLAGPVPPNYRVGPGDELILVITGDVEFIHDLVVTREGFIVIPQVGQLSVASLTMDELRMLLKQRLGRVYSGIKTGTTKFDVTIAKLRTNQVFVIGEVEQPGAYQLSSVATALNALYAAGGPSDRGNFRQILVRRAGQVIDTLDLYDYLLNGDTKNDIVLEQGDVIFVPVRGVRAKITGAVVRPAIYELKQGQTLKDLIADAGGFVPGAALTQIEIFRQLPPDQRLPGPAPRTVLNVQLPTSVHGARDTASAVRDPFAGVTVPHVALEDGDSVAVDYATSPEASLFVTIAGVVRKPDSYPWHEGMTLHDLVRLAAGPGVGADLREAEIAHLPADRTGGRLAVTVRVPMDSSYLMERDSSGHYIGAAGVPFPAAGSAPEVSLQPFDKVTIFRQPQFELQRSVNIRGEVEYPGNYALETKDERLSSLVKRAGGLLPTAYAQGARLYRVFDNAGRVDMRLTEALRRPGSSDDVILQPGDTLTVPEYNPTVKVQGAVNAPTSVLYQPGQGLGYYIANAGGYAVNADKGRVSVRYANGSAKVKGHRFLFFGGGSPTPGPGSTITVPVAVEGPPFDVTRFAGSLAQILASSLAIVLLATKL